MTAPKVEITDTEPTPLVKDFGIFVKYIKEKNPSLVRKDHFLSRGALSQIGKLISTPDPDNILKTTEFLHPYFTLFYYMAVKGNLFIKTPDLHLKETERLSDYSQLAPPEKYFFLLKTFWVDADWSELLNKSPNLSLIPKAQSYIGYLARTSGKIIPKKRIHNLRSVIEYAHYFLEYLSFFGLIRVTCEESSEIPHSIQSAAVTGLGELVFPILYTERNLLHWNIPYIRETTETFSVLPGSENKNEPFFELFQKFVGDLETLPRRYTKGTFTVKVSLRNCSRTIVVSSEHTLEELHEAIQDAFAFDRDHLYAFFTDGKPWSNAHIYAPEVNEGPFSDQVSIGDLELFCGQLFLYIFDFGDEWKFKIEVLDFNSEPGPPTPVIRERKGKSPEQYPLYD